MKTQLEKGDGVLDEIMDADDAADPVLGAACDAYTEGMLGLPDDRNLSEIEQQQAQTLYNRMIQQVRDNEVADASVRTACAIHMARSTL